MSGDPQSYGSETQGGNEVKKNCAHCNLLFDVKPYRMSRRKYCNWVCRVANITNRAQRDLIVSRKDSGESFYKIAKDLGISPVAVRTHYLKEKGVA
jgi:hypothetical protein